MGKSDRTVPAPGLDAVAALTAVAKEMNLPAGQSIEVLGGGGGLNRATTLGAPGLSLDDIPAKLQYVMTPKGLTLTWNFVIRTADTMHWYDVSADASTGELAALHDWVDHASYRGLKLPTENVDDGGFATINDPADPVASPFGWHDTDGIAGAEFTDTRGNNTHAHLDRNGDDVADAGSRPSGGSSLDFSGYTFNASGAPSTAQNKNAAVVNLFYANNMAHDIHFRYGFDEVSGNFQVRNYSGLGVGGDPLQADAQDAADAGATDNANMATPPEGFSPRMQMYEFTFSNPRRDSDLDNGIIIHEFGHGVSNRLTGGPANANALDAQQSGSMGEGWSDWWGLMLTQRPTDTQNQRMPIGNYVLNQSASGGGIRRFPYSFDMSINPLTLGSYNNGGQEVHDAGEIWCAVLWDLNWALINKYGFDANLLSGYDKNAGPGTPTGAGNKLVMQLVMDGLKLQPANPTFLDARDAIIQADLVLTGGKNFSEIWTTFARRGFGFSADAGGSPDSFTVTEAFDLPSGAVLRERFDTVTSPALPFAWSSQSASGSSAWTTSTTSPFNGVNNAFVPAAATASDTSLVSRVLTYLPINNQLSFQNSYDTESGADFGKLEISVNGAAFTDIIAAGGSFVSGGYTSAQGWSGDSGGYVKTTVSLPASAVGKPVQFRWRLTTNGSVGGTGWRIDDVAIDLPPQPDFGDAPDTYGTSLASNGPRHITTGPTLGVLRDGEPDAVKPLNGNSDPSDDGVTQGVLTAGQQGTLVVNVSGSSFLNAWVDLDRNGLFDAGEQIATNRAMNAGNNTLNFNVPASPAVGVLYARFRLTSATVASPSPAGPLSDGEVEDYALKIGRVFENFDTVTAPDLPSGWSDASSSSSWVTTESGSFGPPNNAFVANPGFTGDNNLTSPEFVYQTGDQIAFSNNYNTEPTYDGGVLEISINGGSFDDILAAGGSFVEGGYNGTISTIDTNPLAGRPAWTGNSGGYITTTVILPDSGAGQPVRLRWREGTDSIIAATGWRIDEILTSIQGGGSAPNVAPVLIDTSVVLGSVGPNSPAPVGPVGTLVAAMIDFSGGGGLDNVTDPDLAAVTGIAITGSNATNGAWFYSTNNGNTWNPLGSPSDANARLLAADPNTRIYFQPNPGFTGVIANGITFRAWDLTSGANGGTADASANGDPTAFSLATDTASITVQNSAPVLDISGTPRMIPVATNTTDPQPTQIGYFSTAGFGDLDIGTPVGGVAITSADNTNGVWTYSTDGGTTWSALGGASLGSARLLLPTAWVKFAPTAGYTGFASIKYRAWDQFSGVAGATADLTGGTGGITPFSVAEETASVRVAPIFLLNGEDVVTTGKTTSLIPSATVTDADAKAKKGVAIVGSGGTMSGRWEYFVTAWKPITSVDPSTALPLKSTDKIRFVPDTDAIGEAYLEYRAWDQTEGVAGVPFNLAASGKLASGSAFSGVSDYFFARVTPLNDKPVLDTLSKGSLTPVLPTDTNPAGDLVSAILGTAVADADAGSVPGLAVTGLVGKPGGGRWEYQLSGGSTWTAIPIVTPAKALLLGPNDRLRFVPDNTLTSADKSLMFKAWDQTSGVAGTLVNTALGTSFSTGNGTAVCRITTGTPTAPNTAPVLNTAPVVALTNVAEDSIPAGDTVATLLGSAVSDSPGAAQGIALTSLTGTKTGKWQYSLNGKTWLAVPNVSDEAALLLRATDKIRYLPGLNYNGAASISYRAWDQSRGTAGQLGNPRLAGGPGGSGPFSLATESATVSVRPINDPPVLDITPNILVTGVLPNATNPAGDLVSSLLGNRLSDADGTGEQGIGVIRASSAHGIWQFFPSGGGRWVEIGGASTASAYLLRDVDRIRFLPKPGFVGTETITYRGWDQSSGLAGRLNPTAKNNSLSVASETATIYVNAINDRPQLDIKPDNRVNAIPVTIGNPGGTLISAILGTQVQDPDFRDLNGLAVVYADSRNGTWEFSVDNGGGWNSLLGVTAMEAFVLRSSDLIRFTPNTGFAGLTTLKFKAWDRTALNPAGGLVPTVSSPAQPIDASTFSLATELVTLSVNSTPVLNPL